jgi:hypothetical protein
MSESDSAVKESTHKLFYRYRTTGGIKEHKNCNWNSLGNLKMTYRNIVLTFV